MATTSHLGITLLESAQGQKEVTVNEALKRIDALLNHGVIAITNTPPASPVNGDVYIAGAAPTGVWAGKAHAIIYYDQIWRFITPNIGTTCWVQPDAQFYVFNGTGWQKGTFALQSSYKQMVEIPAAVMRPAVTSGCATIASVALGANKPDVHSLNFDASLVESAMFSLSMPQNWNLGGFTAVMVWSHLAASGSGVVWSLKAVCVPDTITINTDFGMAVSQLDTGGVANRLYISPETATVTPGGTASAGVQVFFCITREATHVDDTLSVDARLHSIRLYYHTTSITPL